MKKLGEILSRDPRVAGSPFRLTQTPLLRLDFQGLSEADPLMLAKDNLRVLVLETMRQFPTTLFHWEETLNFFASLGRSA